MKKSECKIEMFKITCNRLEAPKEFEKFINSYTLDGWEINTILFHPAILTYEVVFERTIDE